MSSAVHLTFIFPIPLERWHEFCAGHDISYSPMTVGKNVYYRGDVEITFGSSDNDKEPEGADEINVSTYYDGDLRAVAAVVRLICLSWNPSKIDPDPEFHELIASYELT